MSKTDGGGGSSFLLEGGGGGVGGGGGGGGMKVCVLGGLTFVGDLAPLYKA